MSAMNRFVVSTFVVVAVCRNVVATPCCLSKSVCISPMTATVTKVKTSLGPLNFATNSKHCSPEFELACDTPLMSKPCFNPSQALYEKYPLLYKLHSKRCNLLCKDICGVNVCAPGPCDAPAHVCSSPYPAVCPSPYPACAACPGPAACPAPFESACGCNNCQCQQ